MDKFNAVNERIKRDYAEFLREADQKSEATVRGVEKAILRFEEYTGFRDFGRFNREQAKGFRAALSSPDDENKRLGNSTVLSTLKAVQRFFRWLSVQPGFKSKIDTNAIAYFNLSEKDIRAATSSPTKPSPTMDQLKRALESMPSETILEKRDRAVFALIMMTGIRDNAAASLLLGHVDIDRQLIVQDPKTVRTKNSKLIESVLLPLGPEIEGVLFSWVAYLRDELRWQPNDPLFPQSRHRIDPLKGPVVDAIKRQVWSNSQPIRQIFKQASTGAGLPYFTPHQVRNTVVEYAYLTCRTPEEFKAFSQNLGHESVVTTLSSYGQIPLVRQRELIRNAGKSRGIDEKIEMILARLGVSGD
ncbi:site-specific integrase [Primorskyibacter sp. 2E233]|uniref:site-specific integrase n=1 Tax=Primorskyibacter sp. 2E233 TaxID=3413431 RepID=UPI003BF311D5